MTDPPLRIAIWTAVSSKSQAGEDKTSLEDQETAGRQFAAALDARVVAVYQVQHTRDIIFWTDAEEAIPAYRHLREDVAAGRFDLLWALDVDRLGREPALQQQVIALVEREGDGEVYLSTNPHPVGQKGIGHRYIESLQGVRAAEDQALRVHRHGAGMRARVFKRGLMASNPPRGYDVARDPHTGQVTGYTFNAEIATVDQATELFLAGHSYAEITRRLDQSHALPGGRRWSYTATHKLLHNDTYAGLPSWAGHRPDEPSPHIPARWDPPTFAAIVRERRRRNRAPYHRLGAGPLTGVAYCARCDRPMVRYRTSARWYIRCPTQARKSVTGRRCHANHLPESAALDALAAHLRTLDTPAALDAALDHLGPSGEETRLQEDIARARTVQADLVLQRERLALALAAGKMAPDIYHTTDTQIRARLEAETSRLQALEQDLAALPDLDATKKALASLASAFPELLTQAEPAELSRLLQDAGIRLSCESGVVTTITLR